MSIRQFNPDGGDMGIPEPIDQGIKLEEHITRAAKLLTLVQALADVAELNSSRFCYGFRIPLTLTDREFDSVTRQLTLPNDVIWYSVDGKKLFELRGPSGGVASTKVAYLITMKR